MNAKRLLYLCVLLAIIAMLVVPTPTAASGRPPGVSKQLKSLTSSGLDVQDLTGTLTPSDLANELVGAGVTISNVTFSGAENSSGIFSGGEGIIGFDSGILLTSGSVANVVGPNQYDYISTANNMPGDPDLNILSGYTTYDAAVLEFDFVPNGDHVSFQFVFGSDEYNEFVNSQYNDVFGFFINGVNCALVENSPVSVNTINNGNPYGTTPNSHPGLYINNDLSDGGGSLNTEMDGLTEVLTCSSAVIPNQPNHLKLAIADASDYVLDSAVFIKAASVTTERIPVILIPGMTASVNWPCFLVEEGCGIESDWTWVPILAEPVYHSLITRLNDAGYTEENKYLNILYYDWRKPIASNVAWLKQRIETVKAATGKSTVDLIGHSMGGLLARAYIQSDSYGGDVAHLVTLGSPHYGSAKSYPYWEAADFYEMNLLQKTIFGALMVDYMAQELNPIAVYVLRDKFPSMKDLLPTDDYLYSDSSDQLIPESSMLHRNTFLEGLNANLNTLFNRTTVATFAGTGVNTTERFYVQPRNIWEWPNWDDGRPNWNIQDQFYTQQGDSTVITNSALLPSPSKVQEFSNVEHSGLPGNNDVINAIFSFLNISVAPPQVNPIQHTEMVFYLYGPVQATITDPQGGTLGPSQTSTAKTFDPYDKSTFDLTGTIPGAEYINIPGDAFKLILIPDPVAGDYNIAVNGTGSGDYKLGLLDTFNDSSSTSSDLSTLWDTSHTQTEPSATTSYFLTYTTNPSSTIHLMAQTPVIELPVQGGDLAVSGLALPSSTVEIRDADTNALLGTGTTSADGNFIVSLSTPLVFDQRIYPIANGIAGIPVNVQSIKIYLPIVMH